MDQATGSDGLKWRIVVTDLDAKAAGLFEPEKPVGVVPLVCDWCGRVVGCQNVEEAAMRDRIRSRFSSGDSVLLSALTYVCHECREAMGR